MHVVFAGLTTLDVIHALDHRPDPETKTTSVDYAMAAGGPATNAAITAAALEAIAQRLADGSPATRMPGTHALTGTPAATDFQLASALGAGEALGTDKDPGTGAIPSPLSTPPAPSVTLATALGQGPTATFLAADIDALHVRVLDASEGTGSPAVSSIVEHPEGRMVASTNARLAINDERGRQQLAQAVAENGAPDAVLVDGHNPALAEAALMLGVQAPDPDEADPFALLDAKPCHLRVLDGGSWKDWFTPLLSLIDVAVVSADFCPPLINTPVGEDIAQFLRGFGITRTVRTRGPEPVQWWWDGKSGEVEVPGIDEDEAERTGQADLDTASQNSPIPGRSKVGESTRGSSSLDESSPNNSSQELSTLGASTLGAGDIFHGAFVWALAHIHAAGSPAPTDPTGIIRFASSVAALSTRTFGTRRWRDEPALVGLVEEFLRELS
ncbi:kinase [Schaalia vaccimaxillae]|uniref:kinase n=1 Tax=Schaalia vaccimaxillae TaxID=183916 RepID=UPI001FB17FE9|nr:kinase [Schaalia vaccimaxillae]